MATSAIELTDTNFDEQVLKSDLPVLVDFWAEWCGPCRMLSPTIEALAQQYSGKIRVGKLDTDSNREAPTKYQITALPTILLFSKGQIVRKFVGLRQQHEFEEAINALSVK